jgi:hypothetical protein
LVYLKDLSYLGTSAGGLAWVDITVPASTKLSDILSDRVDITDNGTAAWQSTTPVIHLNVSLNRLRVYGTQALFTTGTYADAQMVYPLATPTTSSVTPTNLPIKSLFGYNHIESTTGDMEIEYITEEFQPIVEIIESNSGKHVYSTQEQVVGKWIDGSVVYEKTYDIGYLTSNNKTIAHGISGFGHIIQVHGYVTNGTYDFHLPHVTTDAVSCVGVHVDSTNIYITSYDRSDYHGYAIIQYTKSTQNRSLNLTKSAVEEIPDEIKNAEYEEKPDVNEADDDAPTEEQER